MTMDVMEILQTQELTKVCAPMVRYSKLAFRSLVRKYNCDICFTPMILANAFVQSSKARDNEFSTNIDDRPLIVQFAANEPVDFADAAELVAPYANGVDLNCGCPQRWAMHDGYGASLLDKPQLVKDLVCRVRNRIPSPFTVSVKIRILKDIKKTIKFCQILEHAGVSFLTVHARTPQMRKEPIDLEALKLVRDSVKIPVIANGNVKSLQDAEILYQESRCHGVMVANGLLKNPALFAGDHVTPITCIQDWLDIASVVPMNFLTFHHHLIFMLEKILPYTERIEFNNLKTNESVKYFIKSYYGITTRNYSDSCKYSSLCPITCDYKTSLNMTKPRKHNSILMTDTDDDLCCLSDIFNNSVI